MNYRKKYELQKKINQQLANENLQLKENIAELEDKVKFGKCYNSQSGDAAKDLMTELSKIRQEYTDGLSEIKNLQEQYQDVISTANDIKDKYRRKFRRWMK